MIISCTRPRRSDVALIRHESGHRLISGHGPNCEGVLMRVYLWGTRGSLPASTTAKSIEARIFKAIKAARSHDLNSDDAALDQYLLDTRKYLNIHDNTSMMTVSLAYDGLVIDL